MVVKCDIHFENNPEGCFYAGQVVSGKVTLSADKVKQVKAVILKIDGVAHTRWDENENSDRSTVYHGDIDYIKTLTYLLTPAASDEAVIIEPGVHSFNFVCHIPTHCPSSYEGHYGYVRYMVQVNLQRPWKFDQKFTKGFTVLKIMNLNYDTPLLKMPIKNEMSKVFCCGPFKSDPFQMLVQLPRTGYVPGEFIPVNILVTNETKTDVNEICVRLVMSACMYSQRPRVHTRTEDTTVATLIGDPVLPLCRKQFYYLLPVPATPPTCFNMCSIIQIGYRVEVEAKIKGAFYANQEVHTTVTIGNVPLSDVVVQQPLAMNRMMAGGKEGDEVDAVVYSQESTVSMTQPWQESLETPPPVFMEAIFMPHAKLAEASQHDYGDEMFTPKYPVFNIPSPTAETVEENETQPAATNANKSTWL